MWRTVFSVRTRGPRCWEQERWLPGGGRTSAGLGSARRAAPKTNHPTKSGGVCLRFQAQFDVRLSEMLIGGEGAGSQDTPPARRGCCGSWWGRGPARERVPGRLRLRVRCGLAPRLPSLPSFSSAIQRLTRTGCAVCKYLSVNPWRGGVEYTQSARQEPMGVQARCERGCEAGWSRRRCTAGSDVPFACRGPRASGPIYPGGENPKPGEGSAVEGGMGNPGALREAPRPDRGPRPGP